MLTWLKQFTRSRYVGLLEEEIARLRAENRALMNSLLGTALCRVGRCLAGSS